MNTYRHLVYYVLDLIKGISDDFYYTEDHVIFALNKYRAAVLKEKYDNSEDEASDEIPESNYQTMDLTLVPSESELEGISKGPYLVSKETMPDTLLQSGKVYCGTDYFGSPHICMTTAKRLPFVGNNKYLTNFIYCAFGPDKRVYLKSSNPQFRYLKKATFTGIFEDPLDALEEGKDPLDAEFPLEEGLVPSVIEGVLRNLLGAAYRPEDTGNDARDILADLASFIRNNMKSNFNKQMDNE